MPLPQLRLDEQGNVLHATFYAQNRQFAIPDVPQGHQGVFPVRDDGTTSFPTPAPSSLCEDRVGYELLLDKQGYMAAEFFVVQGLPGHRSFLENKETLRHSPLDYTSLRTYAELWLQQNNITTVEELQQRYHDAKGSAMEMLKGSLARKQLRQAAFLPERIAQMVTKYLQRLETLERVVCDGVLSHAHKQLLDQAQSDEDSQDSQDPQDPQDPQDAPDVTPAEEDIPPLSVAQAAAKLRQMTSEVHFLRDQLTGTLEEIKTVQARTRAEREEEVQRIKEELRRERTLVQDVRLKASRREAALLEEIAQLHQSVKKLQGNKEDDVL